MSNRSGDHKPRTHELTNEELSDVSGGRLFNFGDIKGESTDKDHKDWVFATRGTVTPSFGEFVITKRVDKSAP